MFSPERSIKLWITLEEVSKELKLSHKQVFGMYLNWLNDKQAKNGLEPLKLPAYTSPGSKTLYVKKEDFDKFKQDWENN